MKKIKFFMLAVVVMLFTACHDKLWDSIEDLDSRVTKLEELCKEMNTNISALQTIVSVIQENDFITGIVPIEKGGEVIGYTIMFGKHEPITIYNGEDGANGTNGVDGKDGYTPILGVAKDTDGVYYWTLNGEWLLDAEGNKIRVTGRDGKDGADGKDGVDGEDGKDGQDGTNGTNGADGKDGVTPQLKIEEGYWYISYDNGATWTELGKAVGEDGKDGTNGTDGKDGQDGKPGADGKNGDSMFTSVTYDENNVYFTLTDGSVLIVPRGKNGGAGENDPSDIIKFEDLNVKSALLQMNIKTNGDGEISYGEAANYRGSLVIKNNTNILSFKECQYFTGVTSVSFEGCTNLFEIVLPNSLDTISNKAFYNNDKLTFIAIPDSCEFIGDEAFSSCNKLNSIYIPDGCTSLKIGSKAFYQCYKINSIVIPSGCDTIMDQAFSSCTSLSELEIKNGCLYIGNNAFSDCLFKDINLPNSIEYLGEQSFNCKNTITSFTYPQNLKYGGIPYGFYGSSSGSSGYRFPNFTTVIWNAEDYKGACYTDINIYDDSAYGLALAVSYSTGYGVRISTLTNVIIGENVKTIPDYLCYYSNITTITLPENITSIGNSAFYGCKSLYLVYSKNPVPPVLGRGAFAETKIGIIYVPTPSVDVYKAAWSDYADKIVGHDF